MTEPPPGLREAVERNAEAVKTGNFAQLMADITPEALARLLQIAPPAGQVNLTQMPAIRGYTIEELGEDDGGHDFRVTFDSERGTATLQARWKAIFGQWKIADVTLVDLQLDDPPAPAPAQGA